MYRTLLVIALALSPVLPVACEQEADYYEPNNEIGDASELGLSQAVFSSIFPAQDVDFYKIHLETPGILRAQLSSVPPEMKGRIDLYGSNMNWLTRKDAENPGESVVLEIDIGRPGWYYLAVRDLSGGSYGSEYSFVISFEPVVDEEPNNELGVAIEITPGESVKGYIFPAGDLDCYKVFLNNSGILKVNLYNVPKSVKGSMKGRIDLYGINMNWLTRMDAKNAADDVTLELDIGRPGWYYLGVLDLNGGSYNQTYDLLVDFEPVIDLEPNNEIGDASEIQFGNAVKGFIFPAGDGDVYKIYVDSPGSLQASLEDVPKSDQGSMRGRIDFYGKNMNWVTRKDAGNPGDNVLLKVDVGAPGWYYFGISDLSGGSYAQEYTFVVTK